MHTPRAPVHPLVAAPTCGPRQVSIRPTRARYPAVRSPELLMLRSTSCTLRPRDPLPGPQAGRLVATDENCELNHEALYIPEVHGELLSSYGDTDLIDGSSLGPPDGFSGGEVVHGEQLMSIPFVSAWANRWSWQDPSEGHFWIEPWARVLCSGPELDVKRLRETFFRLKTISSLWHFLVFPVLYARLPGISVCRRFVVLCAALCSLWVPADVSSFLGERMSTLSG